MKLTVRATLTLHAIIVSVLLLIPIFTLFYLSNQSEAELKRIDNINTNVLIPLVTIDGALKNARFHSYAGFMHDKNLSVSHYHTHPFQLHVDIVKNENDLAEKSWQTILDSISPEDVFYQDLIKLKSQYESYMVAGGRPVYEALSVKDWDSIVRIVTAAIPQYAEYSDSAHKTLNDIKNIAKQHYEMSLQELSSLKNTLTIVYVLLVAVYFAFSVWLQRRIITPLNENVAIAEKLPLVI